MCVGVSVSVFESESEAESVSVSVSVSVSLCVCVCVSVCACTYRTYITHICIYMQISHTYIYCTDICCLRESPAQPHVCLQL